MRKILALAVLAVAGLCGQVQATCGVSLQTQVVSPFVPLVTVHAPVAFTSFVSNVVAFPSVQTVSVQGCASCAQVQQVQQVQSVNAVSAFAAVPVAVSNVAVVNSVNVARGGHRSGARLGGGRKSVVRTRTTVRSR